ncbi:MAG TPA: DNA repair protein RecO [Spirochaetota bacterium]|jgi:DNA repair protein RecO (recombination protein O)|nr:DNA repair protein RecO [Spirochaetota bacterium]OPZ38743.1 MAG: DNA repair protein RecO [Spirochaetes bacterium ADurb.BinA120]HNU92259.1 DNA repair protein RecO [Spirochaetota bacterium]HPI15325.1 DNA repair protein RecO [Spirochaetota bacterium]HPO46218.1 DNA repair protein RecO [Spirochaetota bacterium]
MEIRKASGLVLHSRQSGEADILARILTAEFGKANFVFKGLKKSRKRSLAAGEPGTLLDLLYYQHDNREFQVVSEFRVVRDRMELRKDLSRILHLYYLLELVDRTTAQGDPHSRVFALAAAAADALADTIYHAHLSAFFLLHLLRFHGVLPDLSRCARCGRTDFTRFTLDTPDFTPVCGRCAAQSGNNSSSLDTPAREFVAAALSARFSGLDCGRFPAETVLGLLFHLSLFVESYFHCEIKSKGMIFNLPQPLHRGAG